MFFYKSLLIFLGYIKEKILQNEFVTREEYNQLRQLVLKLSEEIKTIEKKLH